MKKIPAAIMFGFVLLVLASAARADKKSDAVLKQAIATMKATQCLTGDISMSLTFDGSVMHVVKKIKCMKPNFMRVDSWDLKTALPSEDQQQKTPHIIAASNGKFFWVIEADGTYEKHRADTNGGNLDESTIPVSFFDPAETFSVNDERLFVYAGTEMFNGVMCDVLDVYLKTGGSRPPVYSMKIYFGPDHIFRGSASADIRVEFSHVKIDAHLTKADFTFTMPPFVKAVKKPAN